MRGLKLVKSHGFRVVAGLGLLLGTLGLGSNLSLASTQLTNSTPTTLYASVGGSDTGPCTSSADSCNLGTALSTASTDFSTTTPNVTIMLTTSSITDDYVSAGGFTVNTGTSSSDNITIENYDNNTPVLNGNNASTVLTVNGSGTLSLIGVTITGGNSAAFGGGIYNNNTATLTLTDSTVSDNSAGGGGAGDAGGIFNNGTLTLTDSTVFSELLGYNNDAVGAVLSCGGTRR